MVAAMTVTTEWLCSVKKELLVKVIDFDDRWAFIMLVNVMRCQNGQMRREE